MQSRIKVFDLIMCLSNTIGLADQNLVDHNKQVAFIALNIGRELGLTNKEILDLVLAGIFHDIGSFSVKEKEETLKFVAKDVQGHAEKGYQLLKTYSPLKNVADIVRFHHVFWKGGEGVNYKGYEVPLSSHIIHLADRISILIKEDNEILSQAAYIHKSVLKHSDSMFKPELVAAFNNIRKKESFWLDITSNNLTSILKNVVDDDMLCLDIDGLVELSQLISKIIDFRSSFTATHSSGVACTSAFLAEKIGFSENECKMMKVAGYLHDLGKLAIPTDILEKKAGLSAYEFNVMKSHVYHTYRTLQSIEELNTINTWASLHHERLNGKGYPFRLSGGEIPLGARIMAVSDVFTAITEDRPYRKGMDRSSVLNVLDNMVKSSALDPMVVSVLKDNLNEVNRIRIDVQKSVEREYKIIKRAQ